MTVLNVRLPDELKEVVNNQVSRGRSRSANAYVLGLIRDDQKRQAQEDLEAKLLEGLKGPAAAMTANEWADVRRQVAKKLAARGRRRVG